MLKSPKGKLSTDWKPTKPSKEEKKYPSRRWNQNQWNSGEYSRMREGEKERAKRKKESPAYNKIELPINIRSTEASSLFPQKLNTQNNTKKHFKQTG